MADHLDEPPQKRVKMERFPQSSSDAGKYLIIPEHYMCNHFFLIILFFFFFSKKKKKKQRKFYQIYLVLRTIYQMNWSQQVMRGAIRWVEVGINHQHKDPGQVDLK